MAIKQKSKLPKKIEIDLTGPAGNAFVLLGTAKRLCQQLEREFEPIKIRMQSGDYENLIQVFDEEFGDFVDLLR